jgi:GT2 family glycosyltransferase
MQVSFIIPLYNCLAHTRECLRTLQATLPAGLAHEILFVDDGSTDGTRAWLAQLPAPCRALLNERNLGFAGACNRGAAAARGELLFFLNNDLVLQRGWFEPMRDAFDRFPRAGLVGNLQRNAATGALDHAGIRFDHKGKPGHVRALELRDHFRAYRRVPAVTGACFALRRTTWRELGGFDDGFCNGGEDIDLALKADAAGRENLVALRSVVLHHVSASAGRKLRDEQNSCRLARRWRTRIAALSLRAWCRHHLALRWDGARDPADFALAARLLLFLAGAGSPPPEARAGLEAALDAEERRWRELGVLQEPPRTISRTTD